MLFLDDVNISSDDTVVDVMTNITINSIQFENIAPVMYRTKVE